MVTTENSNKTASSIVPLPVITHQKPDLFFDSNAHTHGRGSQCVSPGSRFTEDFIDQLNGFRSYPLRHPVALLNYIMQPTFVPICYGPPVQRCSLEKFELSA